MKLDISDRKDIRLIIMEFYDALLMDDKMRPFFEDIVSQNHLYRHIEIVTDFWNDILFYTTSYKNNTMQKHLDRSIFIQFRKEHFTIWMSYFSETIDFHFKGLQAEQMKTRAMSIATVMQLKMKVF